MEETVRIRFYDFIRASGQGVVATVAPGGAPEAALMDLAVMPDLTLVFETTNQTRKFANLAANPRIAVVVGWEGGETLQLDGVAEQVEGRALEEARAFYLKIFPDKLSHQNWPGNFYFRVTPVWVRFSNYDPPRKIEEYSLLAQDQEAKGFWRMLTGKDRRQHN